MEVVGKNVAYPGVGGIKSADLRPIFQGRGPSHNYLLVREVGPDSLDVSEPWYLPPQGGPLYDGAAATVTSQQGVVLTTPV